MKSAKLERAANSFEVIAREWFQKNRVTWAVSHADKVIRRLENDVFPWLGSKAIAEITAPDVLAILRRIEAVERSIPHTVPSPNFPSYALCHRNR